ncbi:MAG: ABC transporter ATP-binding protein [Lachnospiraceae bacterium]|jgi:ATP-binding cassette subfamily B protein
MNKIFSVVKTLFGTAAKKYPWFFVMEFIKTIIQICMPFIGIILTPMIVDEICGEKNIHRLITLAAVLIVTECILGILQDGLNCQLSKYQERLSNYFTMQIGMHSMNLDFQLTEDKAALDQLDRAKTGMTWYSGGVYGIAEQVFMFFGNIFKIVGFITIIALNAPWMLLFITLFVIANSFVTAKCNKVDIEAFNRLSKVNRLFGYFGWTIVDFRYGKDVRLYDAKDMLVNRWRKNSQVSNDAWKWQGDTGFKYKKYSVLARTLMNLALYMYTGMLVVAAKITIGIFTQIIEASGALDSTLNGLIWNIQELIKKCNYAYEYVVFMEYPEAIEKNHDAVKDGLHTIEFRHVSFAYPNTDKLILDDINITINPGEKLSIVGLNGAGKTTFIKLLCRLYDPTAGQILMDGKDVKEYDYQEYMKQFAPVFQDFKLFGFSIGENILQKDASERTEEDNKKLNELMKLVELDGLIEKNKNGIDTLVFTIFDEEGIEPSGGEQQKIAIARALQKDAPVIILDEPTSALDPVAEYEIYRQFHTLVGNKTAFYISHRLSSCRFCDRIAVFSDGKIAEYGNHDSLIKIPEGIYAKMFEAQAQYYR